MSEDSNSKSVTDRTVAVSSQDERARRLALVERLRRSPIPDDELASNLGLYLTRQTLSRINLMQRLYQTILPVHGLIMEFGVRWGQNLALFSMLRGMLEPYNFNRKLIGFDTFAGFPSVDPVDGGRVAVGDYAVTAGWQADLEAILDFHEANAPLAHVKKYELVAGDATETLPAWLDAHPEAIVALAYFDFDLYRPTKDCLETLLPRLTKGSVVAFDELNYEAFPGETVALREVLGLGRYRIQRDPSNPLPAWIVIE